MVLGHEGAGVVEAVGVGVNHVQPLGRGARRAAALVSVMRAVSG
ncbi:hypothetical protein AB0I02_44835 [Streptomyces phaeochromogenes]